MPASISAQVDWSSVRLYSLNVEHVRQQDKYNLKQKEQSDVVFSFDFNNGSSGLAICHIENQTEPEQSVLLRTLHYQTSILLDVMKANPGKPLPLVFSVIYYANKKPFCYSNDIYEYFADPDLAKRYAFKPKLVDLSAFSDAELAKSRYLSGYELVFKHIRHQDLEQVLGLVSPLLSVYDSYIQRIMIKYMSHHVDMEPDKFYDILIENESALEAGIMTVAEQWERNGIEKGMQRGMQQGIQQGMQQGVQQGMDLGRRQGMKQGEDIGRLKEARAIALRLLNAGYSTAMVAEMIGFSEQEVVKLKDVSPH